MPKAKKQNNSKSFLSQIRWGESYTSLFLGAIVVIVGLFLLFSFLKTRNIMNQQTESTSTRIEQNSLPSTYVVKKGDDLWTISKTLYGSGYNWVDLANANKLKNPNVLYAGVNLNVPNIKPRVLESKQAIAAESSITGTKYTVSKGDYLWNIALRAYGDGYKWVEIARANKLVNPNIIHKGNILYLPR